MQHQNRDGERERLWGRFCQKQETIGAQDRDARLKYIQVYILAYRSVLLFKKCGHRPPPPLFCWNHVLPQTVMDHVCVPTMSVRSNMPGWCSPAWLRFSQGWFQLPVVMYLAFATPTDILPSYGCVDWTFRATKFTLHIGEAWNIFQVPRLVPVRTQEKAPRAHTVNNGIIITIIYNKYSVNYW